MNDLINLCVTARVQSKEKLWEELKAKILSCQKCSTRKEAFYPVPGEGNLYAEVMVVGRAPGKTENIQGKPFCGPSGRSLDWFLDLADLSRQDIFITNMCLCYPQGDRPNTSEEVFKCRDHFKAIINLIRPMIVVVCGTQAVKELTGLQSLSVARGKVWSHAMGFKVVCILHPGTLPVTRFAKRNVEALRKDAFLLKEVIQKCKEERK